MRGVLLLNGEPYTGKIDAENAFVVCCDGAYEWAKDKVKIDENVGDFDSLPYMPAPPPAKVYPSQKNHTDGEIGLARLLEIGCKEIFVYGGGGGREDHFAGNLHLLYAALLRGARAEMITASARIFLGRGRVEIAGERGKTVSLLPFGGDAHIIDGEGFFYSLRDLTLSYGSCRGLSNVVMAERARFDCDRGTVLIFVNRGGKTV